MAAPSAPAHRVASLFHKQELFKSHHNLPEALRSLAGPYRHSI